jgi:hypothetical protein
LIQIDTDAHIAQPEIGADFRHGWRHRAQCHTQYKKLDTHDYSSSLIERAALMPIVQDTVQAQKTSWSITCLNSSGGVWFYRRSA